MKIIGTFLLAYWLYEDGVATIVRMAVKVGSSMGFEPADLILAILMVQFIGVPAALLYNWFGSKIGVKNAVLFAICGYGVATILGYLMTEKFHFYLLAVIIGCFQGGIQALSRSLFSRLIPKGKEAEFFGFYNMLGKFAAVFGPMIYGFMRLYTGERQSILSIIILFVLGGALLLFVDEEKGKAAAREMEKTIAEKEGVGA